ncbi:beta-1,3-galactosyl-O-glycosyl-glycoprotein beta-1,6-N-acetylglucosaminyltransferase 3-like [Liolophura sinensis]|uniref:beta-1,3-galactosyl-O-glycosyl-glycoprotein beta-1,6-N-acetylglucosaminyltransferase 3-like n=1 Tax=Liolophura sinensis TaxID=3198878 RepID=UPI003158914A
MKDLLRFKWRYFINLTGQEFPLKTNKELVEILTAYKGANDIRGTSGKFDQRRVMKKGPPPFNLTLMKGPIHIAASRDFVQFIFEDRKTQVFLEWLRGTQIPDETFYATINNNPFLGAPGGFHGPESVRESMTSFIRYKQWGKTPCSGKYQRQICIFNVGDLPRLVNSKALFANKFLSSYGQYAYDCLEQLHWNRVIDDFHNPQDFDTSFYSALPNVVYRN